MEGTRISTASFKQIGKDIIIRLGVAADIPYLPAIEESASEIFKSIPDLEFIADDPPLSIDTLHSYLSSSHLWVATVEDESGSEIPVAFLAAKSINPARSDEDNQEIANNIQSPRHIYIAECSVHLSFQRRGIAGRLLNTVAEYARKQGFGWLTLITFLDVPWNGKFYQKHGFEEIEAETMGDEYVEILKEELDQWKNWKSKRWRRGVMARKS
ncbi:GNAT family acetyltransferase, putative [Talaromyces stipitatus ATCC 10500]|uniref:GNAT family acetyltransferase, putative n=1 Tax=Talaromyces stipitatus (strain ATCC 10500 / CBS 375.48 / QM 6759 / NRRL 1006) TaxID=441959 RepID=B8MJX2_TALSN|nr:GNAT family acetyltransferase, putative [Talaromyces stipitatus ATCC 10500]EED14789.1 GNAT family acetyltransferase, putative [Talaromyces stipitatus ATCC 10500]